MQGQTLPVLKPPPVRLAIGLLWASLAIGALKMPLDWAYLTSRASSAFNAFVLIFTFGITAFFIWEIGQGKNWARIVLLVLFLLGVVPFVFIVRSEFARSAASGLLSTVQFGLQAVALYLIFSSPAKAWFQPRSG